MATTKKNTQRIALEKAALSVIKAMGLDPHEEGLFDSPRRIANFWMEYCNALDPAAILKDGFEVPETYHGMVTQHNIPLRGLCEHHFVPFLGRVAIGYIPNKRVVGLSKLTRLVDAVATSRPSLQEAICDEVADILMEYVEPRGVIVVAEAEHGCMACRGVTKAGIITTTSTVRGVFRDVPAARNEFFALVNGKF